MPLNQEPPQSLATFIKEEGRGLVIICAPGHFPSSTITHLLKRTEVFQFCLTGIEMVHSGGYIASAHPVTRKHWMPATWPPACKQAKPLPRPDSLISRRKLSGHTSGGWATCLFLPSLLQGSTCKYKKPVHFPAVRWNCHWSGYYHAVSLTLNFCLDYNFLAFLSRLRTHRQYR